ncbi:MAG TPA: LysR substrate-binding domain-containing protein [Myxococcaceae bacterium]|nr:LysR substrate-binding domain-containing protein [Myxococcaceae bacterium]
MLNEIDLSRADLNLLVLFETVLRERHVGRAASRLHLSASAVSHGLGRLRRLLADPVFLRTPRGVVPTARALELSAPISQVLAGARAVLATAAPFEPRTSTREFVLGAPDGASTLFLPPLLERLRREAPGVNIRLRQLLPPEGGRSDSAAWEPAFDLLDGRALDLAIAPFVEVPARFATVDLREEDFAIVSRRGHPFARRSGLREYCAASHLVVSLTGDPHGFVDRALAERGLSRRVALTVPGFFMALALVAEADLLAAVPRSFALAHAPRAGLAVTEPPIPLPRFQLRVVVPAGAVADAGLAWLRSAIVGSTRRPRRLSAPT